MAKIDGRTATLFVVPVIVLATIGTIASGISRLPAEAETPDQQRTVAYACGYINGQRRMMEIMIHSFPAEDIAPEPDFCIDHRTNAAKHGFREGKQ